MSTITSPDIIAEMLANNGTYPGDPQCRSIWVYTTLTGEQCFKLIYKTNTHEAQNEFLLSPYVKDPMLLWSYEKGLYPMAYELFPLLPKPSFKGEQIQ